MKLSISEVSAVVVLLGFPSISSSECEFAFADLSIHPDWIKIDSSSTSAILSEYADKLLIAESFRYRESESIIVRAFPTFSEVTVTKDHHYCLSEAQDIVIPEYDIVSGQAHGEVFRYPGVVILLSLQEKSQKCPEFLEGTGFFYSINARAESVARLLPHLSESKIRKSCNVDTKSEPFGINLINFDRESVPSADAYLRETGSVEFAAGSIVYELSFSLDVSGPFSIVRCEEAG